VGTTAELVFESKRDNKTITVQIKRFTNCGSSLSKLTFANMEDRTKISEEERKKLAEYRCVAESFLLAPHLPCGQDDIDLAV
jgi:hypothetical protein